MKTCTLNDFMEGIKPWVSVEYIRDVHIDEKDNFVVRFLDGVKNVYRITNCTREQLLAILSEFKAEGIPVDNGMER
jgi:hypothetical protein